MLVDWQSNVKKKKTALDSSDICMKHWNNLDEIRSVLMVNMRKTISPISPSKVKVKTERDLDTSPPSAAPVPVPPSAIPLSSFPHLPHAHAGGTGTNNERRPSPPSSGGQEHKPITLSKLMRARAQRNEFYCKGTGVFSFDLELHRQSSKLLRSCSTVDACMARFVVLITVVCK